MEKREGDVELTRAAVHQPAFQAFTTKASPADHLGLVLDHGLLFWPIGKDEQGDRRGPAFQKLLDQAAAIQAPKIYKQVYERWTALTDDQDRFACWSADLVGRLYLGRGNTSILESGVTLHHTYGVPYVPGSTLKGVARAFAESAAGKNYLHKLLNGNAPLICRSSSSSTPTVDDITVDEIIAVLFGRKPREEENDAGNAGYLIFHEGWWIPDGTTPPLVAEVITVHHRDYYGTGQVLPSDMDSPIPNPQIAIRGSFRFVIEGPARWAKLGLQVLKAALWGEGLGSRRHVGYGRFIV